MSENLGPGDFEKDIFAMFQFNSNKLKGYNSCLQVGCRSRKGFMNFYVPFCRLGYKIHDVLEAHGPNVKALKPKLHEAHKVICGDVRKIEQYEELLDNYDVVIHWHGIEHLTKEEFIKTLPKIMERCNIAFVVGCPNGKYEQSAIHGNPFEKHKHHWLAEELEEFGFKVWTFGSGKPHNREPMMGILWK